MEKLRDLFTQRYKKSTPKINQVFSNSKVDEVPISISIKSYWSTGSNKGQMPKDYYYNMKSMLKYQEDGIRLHLDELEDDYIPYLMPWYGTGVLASSFGCKIKFSNSYGVDPVVENPCINNINDIRKLKIPDPACNGLMQKVLDTIKYMKENSVIPVSLTDIQGPMDTVGLMCGYDKIFLWMEDDPKAVHYLFDAVTETLINWIKIQKKITGEALDELNGAQTFWLPKGIGIWMSEDDLVFIGPKHYEEFIMPYHQKILKEFGSGVIHFCGDASQHIPLFKDLENLAAINTCTLWNFNCVKKLQSEIRNKTVLIVWDIAPLEIEKYYSDFFKEVNLDRIILGLGIEDNLALVKNGYTESNRSDIDIARKTIDFLRPLLNKMK